MRKILPHIIFFSVLCTTRKRVNSFFKISKIQLSTIGGSCLLRHFCVRLCSPSVRKSSRSSTTWSFAFSWSYLDLVIALTMCSPASATKFRMATTSETVTRSPYVLKSSIVAMGFKIKLDNATVSNFWYFRGLKQIASRVSFRKSQPWDQLIKMGSLNYCSITPNEVSTNIAVNSWVYLSRRSDSCLVSVAQVESYCGANEEKAP